MTFSGRIRLYLLLLAVLPPLLILIVIYAQAQRRSDAAGRETASRSLDRFERYWETYVGDLESSLMDFLDSRPMGQARALIRTGRSDEVRLETRPTGLDFVEIVDTGGAVLASHHRPGLVGTVLRGVGVHAGTDPVRILTVEYDRSGPHAAVAYVVPVGDELAVYGGRYLAGGLTAAAEQLVGARVEVVFSDSAGPALAQMTTGQLYAVGDSLQAVLLGGEGAGFYFAATFPRGAEAGMFGSLLWLTGLVALGSVVLALGVGWYISGRAKREIDNLVTATGRVASGDFTTPVMAYEEGEFAQLADSFTEMTFKLKNVQRELATTEKIAAWQAVGRKIAHEVKNPLTPIAISTDDLRRSYHEKLPDFPRVLEETTATIKSEVHRLTQMLDEFVRFARMNPPEIQATTVEAIIAPLENLYRPEMEAGRLKIVRDRTGGTIQLDPDTIRQVLINLVKNGLEAAPDSRVHVTLTTVDDRLLIVVHDTGPGFSEEILGRGFEPYVSTKQGGSGLGLVISQRIVHDHGGTIDLGNDPEGGASITIRLPVTHG